MITKFQNFHKVDVPYITVDVQGVPLNMIVDTGCGISLISRSVLKSIPYEKSPRHINLSALTTDSVESGAVVIPVTVDDKVVKGDFGIIDEDDIANFQKFYGITIHGLLGSEFFQETDCVIDYNAHTVTLN